MPSYSKPYFVSSIINNSFLVKSTKLDSTIKAIINNYKNINYQNLDIIIEYLNTLQIIYYLKRLHYYNLVRYSSTLSKFYFIFLYY